MLDKIIQMLGKDWRERVYISFVWVVVVIVIIKVLEAII